MNTIQPKLKDIEVKIYQIRSYKVMLDSDLATLYGVETKVLNQAVKRNIDRFPEDFRFQLTEIEEDFLRSQFVTLKQGQGEHKKYPSFVFTELGIAMLSSVLKSDQAIQTNIAIMRTFFELRKLLDKDQKLTNRIEEIAEKSNQSFKVVFSRLDDLELNLPILDPNRRKAGL